MPTKVAMSQISRPFQIALVAFLLLAGVWLFALQGHSSSTSTSSTTAASVPSSPAPATTTPARSASSGVAGSNTTAPGVAGLSRAVAKAHQTVTASQQSAKQVEGESAEPAGASAPQSTGAAAPATKAAAPTTTKVTSVTTVHKTATGKTTVHKVTTVHKAPSTSGAAAIPAHQRTVEAALAKGDIVVILFWNHHGADDVAVQRALKPLSKAGKKISVQEASAKEVASFGSVTRGVQVYGTPTILIVNKHGQTTTLTGLQDTYSIQQAIAEAR
jgi:hypothetical protein